MRDAPSACALGPNTNKLRNFVTERSATDAATAGSVQQCIEPISVWVRALVVRFVAGCQAAKCAGCPVGDCLCAISRAAKDHGIGRHLAARPIDLAAANAQRPACMSSDGDRGPVIPDPPWIVGGR